MKRNNRIISLVVTLAIILSSMIIIVPTAAEDAAADAIPAWTEAEASATLAGSGTAEDPYQIATPADFIKFVVDSHQQKADTDTANAGKEADDPTRVDYPEVHYVLTDDLDFSAKHWGIVKNLHKNVEFDGAGKKITVALLDPAAGETGLFGVLNGTYIHDFDFKGIWKVATVKMTNYQGILSSKSYGGTFENINVEFDVDATMTGGSSAAYQGGVCAYATWDGTNLTTFKNVNVTGSFKITVASTSGNAFRAGVYCGRITGATFENCVADLDFTFDRLCSGQNSVTRCGVFSGNVEFDNDAQGLHFINCVNKARFSSTDNCNTGRSGTWIGDCAQVYKADGTVSFENCIDITTWYQSKGAKHAVIGYAQLVKTDLFTAEDIFIATGSFIGAGTVSATKTNVFEGFEPLYVDNGDTVTVYINSTVWENIADELYPVYIAVGFNADDSVTDADVDADLGIATITLDKPDAEAVPAIYYFSTEDSELVAEAAIAKTEELTWASFAASEFDNGPLVAGVEAEIANARQLALLSVLSQSNKLDGYTFKLTADINLAGYEWVPIGNFHGASFKGKIDGQGFSIKNMTLTQDSYSYGIGFIGHTNPGFELKNVTFENPVIAPGKVTGTINGIAAVVCSFYGGTIDSVEITGLDMQLNTVGTGQYIGAFVGYHGQHSVMLKNSTASGKITVNTTSTEEFKNNGFRVGGLVGRTRYGFIENCESNVDIDVTTCLGLKSSKNTVKDDKGTTLGEGLYWSQSGAASVGGILGEVNAYIGELTSIVNCVNNGSIKVTVADDIGFARVGGIIGSTTSKGITYIADSANNGTINVTHSNEVVIEMPEIGDFDAIDDEFSTDAIGGIVGYNTTGMALIINETTTVAYTDTPVATNNGEVMIDGLEVMEGARVRVDTTEGLVNSGLRFDAKINKGIYDAIHNTHNSQAAKDKVSAGMSYVTLGMMIVPVDMLEGKTAADLYADDGILKVDMSEGNFYNVDSEGNGYYSAAIINLKPANYDREFVAIPYMVITHSWGSGTQMAPIFGDINVDNARSAAEVAAKALADTEAGYSSEVQFILNQYIPAT